MTDLCVSIDMPKPNIDILLATYNGQLYLTEQLDSLLYQTYPSTHIYIRDDGSQDATPQIIEEYKTRFPDKITVVEGQENSKRAVGNFSILMNYSTADYILFSDQDDMWEVDKVEKLFSKMLTLEKTSPSSPIFLFSDLKMIDGDGQPIADSLWKQENLNPQNTKLGNLLTQNIANGCASMINRKLLDLGKEIPSGVLMHDHWLIVLAAGAGVVDFIKDQTIRHRIHQKNSSRAESELKKDRNKSWLSILKGENLHQYYQKLQEQAIAVQQRFRERNLLDKENEKTLNDFIELRNYTFLKRKKVILENGFLKNTPTASLNWWLRL